MEQFSDRLNHLLDVHGFPRKGKGRHQALARMFHISQNAVHKWLEGTGKPKTSRIIEIANKFDANIDWLLSGKGDLSSSATVSEKKDKQQSSVSNALTIRWVPVLDWVSAGKGATINIDHSIDNESEYIPVPLKRCSPNSYALKIKGESMISPSGAERSFLPNQIIVADPDKAAQIGDYVIAIIDRDREAVFKQFVVEDSTSYLKPLNPRYPLIKIKGQIKIIATVVYQLDHDF